MTANEIRQQFLYFFQSKKHQIISLKKCVKTATYHFIRRHSTYHNETKHSDTLQNELNCDIQHTSIQQNVMLSFDRHYAECRYAQRQVFNVFLSIVMLSVVFLCSAECRYSECRHTECRGSLYDTAIVQCLRNAKI